MAAPYESWTVYKKALRLRIIAGIIGRKPPRGLGSDLDHFRRGTSSIIYNIAEGAGRFTKADKIHFYRIALGSANECNTILDVLMADMGKTNLLSEAKVLIGATTALLNGLIKSIEDRPDD